MGAAVKSSDERIIRNVHAALMYWNLRKLKVHCEQRLLVSHCGTSPGAVARADVARSRVFLWWLCRAVSLFHSFIIIVARFGSSIVFAVFISNLTSPLEYRRKALGFLSVQRGSRQQYNVLDTCTKMIDEKD
jgi:hypothetical protein